MDNQLRESYLHEMGVVSWCLREPASTTPAIPGFLCDIQLFDRQIKLLAEFNATVVSVDRAASLINAICYAVGSPLTQDYVLDFEDGLVSEETCCIILGEQLRQKYQSYLSADLSVYSKYTVDDLLQTPMLKKNLWDAICSLTV